jgi:hypothetical protein
MKKIVFYCSVLSLFLFSCKKEANSPANPAKATISVQGSRILSEVPVGSGTITFIANGTDLAILTKNLPGQPALLGADMDGLTFAEIHRRLAPGKDVPIELLATKEHFQMRADNSDGVPAHGACLQTNLPAIQERSMNPATADLNDVWFSNNYCHPSGFYNGYQACLLNRTPERGLSTDWAYSNCTRSYVHVYPYKGQQIHLHGQVNGTGLFDVDLPSGYVYSYYMYSGQDWWGFGCRVTKQHYYSITNTAGCGWHWSLWSNTDC